MTRMNDSLDLVDVLCTCSSLRLGMLFFARVCPAVGNARCGSALFDLLCWLAFLSYTRSPASLLASASVSPSERRTHTVFAVWCLGLSRACIVSTSCPSVHVLTHVFSSARFFSCCACRGRSPELGCSELSLHFGMPRLSQLLCVARNTSSLEPPPRRSISQTVKCTARQALLCLVSRDRPQWSFLLLLLALCWRSSVTEPDSHGS